MKTAIDRITIEGQDYVPANSIAECSGSIKIIILQRGWVMIGKFERNGSDCKLHHASVIRRWGTTSGLGQLSNGPLSETKLEPCGGVVEFDFLTVIATISVKEEKWESVL